MQHTAAWWHRESPRAPRDTMDVMQTIEGARLIPGARLRIIDDGHLFFLTQPQQTAAILERFLSDG